MEFTKCYLLGHKIGTLNDSGHPVCEKCGCHSYYQFEEFYNSAILMRPIWFIKRKAIQIRDSIKSFITNDNDLPF